MNNLLICLKEARNFQRGCGPFPSYEVIRRLEKKGYVYVYRKHDQMAEYCGKIRPRIFALTLTYDGKIMLEHY